jgi:muramidase (phage lysozyme)
MNRYRVLITVLVIVALAVTVLLAVRYYVMRVSKTDLSNKNVQAFLRVIRFAEGTAGANGYRTMFGGKLFDVSNGWQHPNIRVPFTDNRTGKTNYSTAAGAYQFLYSTWSSKRSQLNLADFSPENQDLAALQLIADKSALEDVKAGRFSVAIDKVKKVWASLPGAGYQQPEKSLAALTERYKYEGGNLA